MIGSHMSNLSRLIFKKKHFGFFNTFGPYFLIFGWCMTKFSDGNYIPFLAARSVVYFIIFGWCMAKFNFLTGFLFLLWRHALLFIFYCWLMHVKISIQNFCSLATCNFVYFLIFGWCMKNSKMKLFLLWRHTFFCLFSHFWLMHGRKVSKWHDFIYNNPKSRPLNVKSTRKRWKRER